MFTHKHIAKNLGGLAISQIAAKKVPADVVRVRVTDPSLSCWTFHQGMDPRLAANMRPSTTGSESRGSLCHERRRTSYQPVDVLRVTPPLGALIPAC